MPLKYARWRPNFFLFRWKQLQAFERERGSIELAMRRDRERERERVRGRERGAKQQKASSQNVVFASNWSFGVRSVIE